MPHAHERTLFETEGQYDTNRSLVELVISNCGRMDETEGRMSLFAGEVLILDSVSDGHHTTPGA